MPEPLSQRGREQGSEQWWGGMEQGGLDMETNWDNFHGHMFPAFRQVLLAMSEEHFQRFMDADPKVVCLPTSRSSLFKYTSSHDVNIIYFQPNTFLMSDTLILSLVAEEVAHLVLGHQDQCGGEWGSEVETAANALVMRWGFKPFLTKAQLRKMREVEKRVARKPRSK